MSSSIRHSRPTRASADSSHRSHPYVPSASSSMGRFAMQAPFSNNSSNSNAHGYGHPHHFGGPRAATRPTWPSSSTASIEDMHKYYVTNKTELTKHISTAAGAQEQLWGGEGWYLRWYESPTPDSTGTNGGSNATYHARDTHLPNSSESTRRDMDFATDSDLLVIKTDIATQDIHNLVEHVNIPNHVTSEAVRTVISRFEYQRRLFSWVVGPQEQPILEAILRNALLWCEELAPTLSVDLDHRDDLFCEAGAQPQGIGNAFPRKTEDSGTLPVTDNYSLPRGPPSQDGEVREPPALWSARKQESRMPTTTGSDPVSTGPHAQHSSNRVQPSHLLFPAQARGLDKQPGQNTETSRVDHAEETPDFHTSVGAFEKLSVRDAETPDDTRIRTLSDGITLAVIQDKAQVQEWVRTWAYQADPGSSSIEHWTSIYTKLIDTLPTNQFRMFAAREPAPSSSSSAKRTPGSDTAEHERGKMIGTGYIHLYSGVASIHCITVLPEHRTKGIGRALTRYAMGLARDMGYRMAMLTGSCSSSEHQSQGCKSTLFRRLGFKEFGRVKLYVYRPLRGRDTVSPESKRIREAESDGWEWVDDEDEADK